MKKLKGFPWKTAGVNTWTLQCEVAFLLLNWLFLKVVKKFREKLSYQIGILP